jgi:hypothetical protein
VLQFELVDKKELAPLEVCSLLFSVTVSALSHITVPMILMTNLPRAGSYQ